MDYIKKEKINLSNNLEKEKKFSSELNIRMSQLDLEQKSLKTKINDLNKNLDTEKGKNNDLNSKLENISSENKENLKKIQNQFENERLINKNLDSKISELEKKEKEQESKKKELEKSIKDKEKIIQNLANNNKDLGNNIEELKKNLNLKENIIKEVNNSLIQEKNINENISQNLNLEKEKAKKLKNELDSIANKNNDNINIILQQLQNEKQINENLKTKYSELKKQEEQKNKENAELESRLKFKDQEIHNFIKNYIPENFGLKFESDSKIGEYDIVLDINSFKCLTKDGWQIKYNKEEGKQKYLKKKNERTIVVGVIGNGNQGKSFILEKLSGYEIPKGFNVKTEGISIRYGTSKDHNVAILDSAGQETPLLKMETKNENLIDEEPNINKNENEHLNANVKVEEQKREIINNEHNDNGNKEEIKKGKTPGNNIKQAKKEKLAEDEENIEFEQYSRDKLITEFFLQKFIIYKSDVLILVVGNISLTEQKLLLRIKKEVKSLDKNKQIFVIHNLKNYSTEEQINDYIENTLKKLYKIEIEETNQQNIIKDNNYNDDNYFNKYFMEKGENVSHFIFINEFSDKANYYNIPTIRHIQKEIEVIKTRSEFSILDDCKDFLEKISEEIIEENIKKENLITVEGEKCDKIILKGLNDITLKKFVVDEVGYTFNNDVNEPKYSYYINPEEKIFYINIELPGGGQIEPDLTVTGNYYCFTFKSKKKGDLVLEEDTKNEVRKLLNSKNCRKSNNFNLTIKVPCSVMQIKLDEGEELNDAGEMSNDGKGVCIFKYKIILVNQKNEKKKKKKLEL